MSNNTNQSKYEELEQIKADLASQAEKLRAQMKDIETRLAAVTLAIEVWKSSKGKNVEGNPYIKELRGLTQVQALLKIAKDNGTNRFKMSEVKKLLLEANVVKSKKNASNILFTTIQRSGKFVRVAPGEYSVFIPPATTSTIKQIA